MSNVFCTECGAKHKIMGSPPKFCSSCGNEMNQSFSPQRSNSSFISNEEDYVPKLPKAKVKIDIGRRDTIGSLNNMPISIDEVAYSNEAQNYSKKSKEQLISEMMRDCGPVTQSKSVDE